MKLDQGQQCGYSCRSQT